MALEEMERLRKDSPLVYEHPLQKLSGIKICLNNIRGWQAHITHFLSDKYFTKYSSVLCFTETKIHGSPVSDISDHLTGWQSIHHPTAPHGLAICYEQSKVIIDTDATNFLSTPHMESLSVLMSIEGEQVLVVLVYRPTITTQREIQSFIQELTELLDELHTQDYNTIVLGDFNLDQMLDPNVELFRDICTRFAFTQRSNYSTHIYGGILDLVFHNKKQEPVEWVPSPYSDHFVLTIDV